MQVETASINPWAILTSALSAFLLGGLWYSPVLFGKAWMSATGKSQADLQKGSPAVVFGGSFVLLLMQAGVFAMFLGPGPELAFALGAGASAGFCWVAAGMGINDLFERRSLKLWSINAGYHTLQFMIFGLILGLWH